MIDIQNTKLFNDFISWLEETIIWEMNDYYKEIWTVKEIKEIKLENENLKLENKNLKNKNEELVKLLRETEKFLRNLWVESEEMFVEYEWYVWVQFKNWDEYLQIVY